MPLSSPSKTRWQRPKGVLFVLLLVGGSHIVAPAEAVDRAEIPVYRYINAAGRPVYVNGLERVPLRFRKSAKPLDLSRISLNHQLGNELKRDVERRVAQLLVTDECGRRRAAVNAGFWRLLWRDHSHLVVIGGFVLLLLLATPWITKRIPAPAWTRVMMIVIPILVLLALWSASAVQATRTLAAIKAKARPCQRDTYRLARGPEGAHDQRQPTLRDQWWMLEQLQKEVASANQRRESAWVGKEK